MKMLAGGDVACFFFTESLALPSLFISTVNISSKAGPLCNVRFGFQQTTFPKRLSVTFVVELQQLTELV
jgi:hypothetical protein